MARVKCRCGETLDVDRNGPERVVCPRCRARIRVRRADAAAADGLIRFHCPCGRRLKVRAENRPEAGRCPDCGEVVPVPAPSSPAARPSGVRAGAASLSKTAAVPGVAEAAAFRDDEARTEEMNPADVARLQRWAARHGVLPDDEPSAPVPPPGLAETPYSPPPALQVEAGLRICPKCKRPLHMSATSCRACGASTPKR